MNKVSKPKILIGSSLRGNFPFTEMEEKLTIDQSAIASESLLTEYDCIILDPISSYAPEPHRINQLLKYIQDKRGLVICLIHRHNGDWNGISNLNYSLSIVKNIIAKNPAMFFDNSNRGYEVKVLPEAQLTSFFDYLGSKDYQWNISVKKEDTDSIIPLAVNLDNEAIAFTVKQFPHRIYFLPYIVTAHAEFCNAVYDAIVHLNSKLENIPEWVSAYTLPTLNDKNKTIEEINNSIIKLEGQKEKVTKEKNYLEQIRNVLFCGSGVVLQNTVKEVLKCIGIDAKDGKNNREDITFVWEKKHFVSEVKGLSKSAGEKDVSQLVSKKIQYEEENLIQAKGILIVNAWKDKPLEQRNTSNVQIFPEQMMKLTQLRKVALLTTQQLFVAYCQKLENRFDINSFVAQIDSTIGKFEGLDNIQDYKITDNL